MNVQALDQPSLHWSAKSLGAGAVLYSSLQTRILVWNWHTEGTEVSRELSPAGAVRGPRIPPASTGIGSE